LGLLSSFPELLIGQGNPHQSQTGPQMLTSYSVLVLVSWLLLVLLFAMTHASERTMSEIIRERR
jgi:hypothetical protein